MKPLLILLLLCVSLSASAIGHPHNLFSAHRKVSRLVKKPLLCQREAPVLVVAKRILGS